MTAAAAGGSGGSIGGRLVGEGRGAAAAGGEVGPEPDIFEEAEANLVENIVEITGDAIAALAHVPVEEVALPLNNKELEEGKGNAVSGVRCGRGESCGVGKYGND